MKIKSLDQIVEKWNRRVAIAGPEYEDGVRNPKRDWASGCKDANDSWKTETAAAIARNAYFNGVRVTGTPKWQEKTLNLGLMRWAPGVAAAGPDYNKGFGPYHSALAALVLPPRRGRGTPQNYERSKKIGETLHALRIGAAK